MKNMYPLAALLGFAAPLITADCQTDWEECLRTKDPLTCDAAKHLCEHPESSSEDDIA